WKKRDPWDYLKAELINRDIVNAEALEAIDTAVRAAIDEAANHCIEGEGSSSKIRANLWPDPITVDDYLTSDMSEFNNVSFKEQEDFDEQNMRSASFIEAMPLVMG